MQEQCDVTSVWRIVAVRLERALPQWRHAAASVFYNPTLLGTCRCMREKASSACGQAATRGQCRCSSRR
jgi:hypothetical protein